MSAPALLRKKGLQLALQAGNPFRNVNRACCKRYSCFTTISSEDIYDEFKTVNSLNPLQAKRYLISLYNIKDRNWYFNGRKVCSRFLRDALGFSNDIQCAVKGTPCSRGPPTARRMPREVMRRTKRWYISNFIAGLAKLFGDASPNKEEFSLPIYSKTTLWKEFEIYWNEKAARTEGMQPSKSYFFRTWKLYCSLVRVRKNHGFTVCSRCEMLRSEMSKDLRNEETLIVLIDQYSKHKRFVENERSGYEKRQSLAEENPSRYCSIILDGADQKNYGLPHFGTHTKSDSGHKLKVKVVGGLEHVLRGQEELSLYAMTEEYETGANHVIEIAHRMIQRKKDQSGRLPSTLFIQVDNCTRENKNRYFMSYFQSLVHLGVFKLIQISFLPIGHNHADIGQAFSSIATHLKLCDAFSLEDLLEELGKCYGGRARAFDLTGIINYSVLCEASGSLTNPDQFSEYRFFRFMRSENAGDDGVYSATCDVKVQETDNWIPFPTSRAEGFLKFVPNFGDAPKTKTKSLPDIAEVDKCLDAAEHRVRDDAKMNSLRELRDKVFGVIEEEFHWDLESAFELRGDYLLRSDDNSLMHFHSGIVEHQIRPNCGFDADDENTPFSIARVKNVSEIDTEGRAVMIEVC